MTNILYIPHGGGPLPLLGDPGHAGLAAGLRDLGTVLAGSRVIVLVTAHWESGRPALTSANRPGMLFDYYGFPEASYRFTYPAPGAPALAQRAADALRAEGFEPVLDAERGFDHGVFVPLLLMRPQADIPVLQVSLMASLDARQHLALGRALGRMLDADTTLIGSGFSFHNLGALLGRDRIDPASGQAQAEAFHDWLDQTVCAAGLSAEERAQALANWAQAPGARYCHPREEHLLPLHVCMGAATVVLDDAPAKLVFSEPVSGFRASGYHWQG